MRTSSYEIYLPLIDEDEKEIEGKALLVNGLYGALDVVDKEAAHHLMEGRFDEIPQADRDRLISRGHITGKDEEGEFSDARLLGRSWRMITGYSGVGLVILPTFNCNFRCPYCFERHRLERGSEWLGRNMSPEMIEAVFAGVQKLRDKGRIVNACTLYGGEPFLKENRETVKNICDHAKAMGLTLGAITNGYDLDAFMDILVDYEFDRLQITVDGVGEENDRRRLHRDGLPTYDKILTNTRMALDKGIKISLRVNTNGANIGGVGDLIHDLTSRGFNDDDPKFSYYFKAVSEDLDSPTRVTEKQVLDAILSEGFKPLTAMRKQSQYSMPLDKLNSAMEKKGYPDVSPAFCGAEEGTIGVGPDGKLFSCWDLVAMEDEAVGLMDVESGQFLFNFTKAKWRTRTSDLMEACRRCPYIFICRGGCAPEAKRLHGSYFREYCGETKEIFAYVASRAAEKKWQETKDDELTLSIAPAIAGLTENQREVLMTSQSQKEMLEVLKEVGLYK